MCTLTWPRTQSRPAPHDPRTAFGHHLEAVSGWRYHPREQLPQLIRHQALHDVHDRRLSNSPNEMSSKGGSKTGRSPVDRGRTGSKHHLITDATGIPFAVTLTGGNRNDVTRLIPLVQAVPPVRGKHGRPRRRPDVLLADRGYDHDKYRRLVWDLGVKPLIARRGTEHGSGLGTQRWFVERACAHLRWFRRARIRWEIRDDIHEALLTLGCSIICWRRLENHHA
jgi:transposase